MQLASEIGQRNREHGQAKGRFTPDSYGPTRRPITPGLLFAAGGKPSTWLPPGGLVAQLAVQET